MSNIVAAWFDRSIISVSGPDAEKYLQGQLSADVAKIPEGESGWSFLLAPTGKIVAWLRVNRRSADTFVLDLDPAVGEDALARLVRFKLRTDAEITLQEGLAMLSLRSVDESPLSEITAGDDVIVAAAAGSTIAHIGVDLIASEAGAITVPDAAELDADAVEALRIGAGIPRHGNEIDDNVIPGELGAWLVEESVSWTKGCYTGQELVARVDSRGNNTPRHLSVLTFAQDSVKVTFGVDVVDASGATVGTITSAGEGQALSLLKRSVEPGATVVVEGLEATVERTHVEE